MGVGDQVTAVRAEAHTLPFQEESFDAIVSVDACEYFGTADNYLSYLVRFLRPGGQVGMVTPAMTREVRELGENPPHIKKLAGSEAIAWQTLVVGRPAPEACGQVFDFDGRVAKISGDR
ncbi:SAM-dependent methyltransferase [Streptomyces sp. NPDC101151]|uniref:SAM-dependent methyltransferase n=1 Tax=Streptomyces sp. NPDC101151 TaxID=3366115 RepID=UPI00381A906C